MDRGSRYLVFVLAAMLMTHAAAGPLYAETVDERREKIRGQLRDLDYAPEAARDAARQLTARDLEVLLANPAMMQRAGSAWLSLEALIFAGLLIGGIVALAISSNSSSMVVISVP